MIADIRREHEDSRPVIVVPSGGHAESSLEAAVVGRLSLLEVPRLRCDSVATPRERKRNASPHCNSSGRPGIIERVRGAVYAG